MGTGDAKAKVYGTRGNESRRAGRQRGVLRDTDAMTADSAPCRRRRAWRGPGASRAGSRRLPAVLVLGYVIAYWGWQWLGPRPVPAPLARAAGAVRARDRVGAAVRTRRRAGARRRECAAPRCRATPGCSACSPAADGTGHALFRLGRSRTGAGAFRRGDREGRHAARSAARRRSHPGSRRNARSRAADDAAAATRTPRRREPPRRSRAERRVRGAGGIHAGRSIAINAELLTGIAARPDGWTALLDAAFPAASP